MYLTEESNGLFMFQGLNLFHRRLIVLMILFMAIIVILAMKSRKLMIVEGEARFEKAMQRMEFTSYLPTFRGQIIDRKGRVIAKDVASYSINFEWDVITGDRAFSDARKEAKESVGNERWQAISPEKRQAFVYSFLGPNISALDYFWNQVAEIGEISRDELDVRLFYIRDTVENLAEVVWARQEEQHIKRYGSDVPFVARPIREHQEQHAVLPNVTDAVAMRFELFSQEYENTLKVVHARNREYPMRSQQFIIDQSTFPIPMRKYSRLEVSLLGVAELIIGDVRSNVWAEDVKRVPFRTKDGVNLLGYRPGDEVGNRGIEFSLESMLRGARGMIVKNKEGDELHRAEAVGGKNVLVTLDMKLQGRIEAILSPELGFMTSQPWHRNGLLPDQTQLRGAVVVLDVESSEVLAMVSTPALRDEVDVEGYPWLNRASDGFYPPGSIIKPLVLVSAMTEDELLPDEGIQCTGHYFDGVKDAARCWIYRAKNNFATHKKLKASEAIARSCNIFFYEIGSRLGFRKLLSWYYNFGLGEPLSLKLTNPNARGQHGHIPSEEAIARLVERGALAFETVSISIGQGAITWSPLHAASAYCSLVRNGLVKSPTIILGLNQEERDLKLNKQSVQLALNGLRDSVAKRYGTGSLLRHGANNEEPIFNVDGVNLWGKTGTAEAPPFYVTKDSKPIKDLDHSWFVVMASHENDLSPTVVVAIVIEHGGSGGRVAGPIANQVIHALQIEGYLKRQ